MPSLTIRNLDDELMTKLRVEAALHGNSLEEEACASVLKALGDRPAITGFGSRIVQRFSAIGGVELNLTCRRVGTAFGAATAIQNCRMYAPTLIAAYGLPMLVHCRLLRPR